LAHELIHATHYARGEAERDSTTVENDSKPDPADPTKHATEKKEEVATAGIPPNDTIHIRRTKSGMSGIPNKPSADGIDRARRAAMLQTAGFA
jgi:hypothetical protein